MIWGFIGLAGIVVAGFFWLRYEFKREVSRLLGSGCPLMGDFNAKITDIERQLHAARGESSAAMNKAELAHLAANEKREQRALDDLLKSAPELPSMRLYNDASRR